MLATDAYVVALRIVHIATGVIWVGSLFVVVVFVQPSAAALGAAGAPFMSELRRRRFVDVVFIDAVFTVVAGAFLYWHDWHTVSDLRRLDRLELRDLVDGGRPARDLGARRRGSGHAPHDRSARFPREAGRRVGRHAPPETAERIGALQRRLVVAERVSFSLVLLAVVAMASARYALRWPVAF